MADGAHDEESAGGRSAVTPLARRVATSLATPIDLRRQRDASDDDLAARLHPAYRESVGRIPVGRQVFRGLPFWLAGPAARRRWIVVDRTVDVDLRSHGPASHVVIAHFCDAWRGPDGRRPLDLPVGWVSRLARNSPATRSSPSPGHDRGARSGAGSRSTRASSAGGRVRSLPIRTGSTSRSTGAVRIPPRNRLATRRRGRPACWRSSPARGARRRPA